jgi:hypothetical protein
MLYGHAARLFTVVPVTTSWPVMCRTTSDLLLLGVPAGAAEELVLVQDGGRDGDALHRDGLHLGGCDGGAGHDQPFFRVA